MLAQGPFWALLMEMGTGKTLALVIWALYKKFTEKSIDSLIILCPKPLIGNEIAEFRRHAANPDAFSFHILEGTYQKKLKTIQEFSYMQEGSSNHDPALLPVLLANYDSLINDQVFGSLHAVTGSKTAVVCDESTKIKSHNSKRAKRACSVAERAGFRGIMTGSPVTESPMDAFGQYRFLSPRVFGGSYYAFRARYAVMGGYGGHEVVGYRNMEEYKKKMLSCSFRVEKKDCLDLPDKVYEIRRFDMPAEMHSVYNQMADDLVAELEGDIFQAPIALTKLMRLKEITSGYIREGDQLRHLKENPKLDILEELVEESRDQKIIVWCRERIELALVYAKLGGKIKVFGLHGDVKDKQALVEEFKEYKGRAVLAAMEQVGGMGYTVVEATLHVYMSNDFSREMRAQSEDRSHRAGQKNKVTYVDIVARGTVDEYTLKVLAGKQKMATSIVDIRTALYFGTNTQPGFEETEF